jgi:hypothetical protein
MHIINGVSPNYRPIHPVSKEETARSPCMSKFVTPHGRIFMINLQDEHFVLGSFAHNSDT